MQIDVQCVPVSVIARPALDYIPPCLFGAVRATIALPFQYMISLRVSIMHLYVSINVHNASNIIFFLAAMYKF